MVVNKRRLINIIPGILQIVIGVLFYFRPNIQLRIMLWLLATVLLISGVVVFVSALISTFRLGKTSTQWGHALINVGMGIALLTIGPKNLATMLPTLSALWIIGSGGMKLILAIQSFLSDMRYWWATALAGIAFILLGSFIFINAYTRTLVMGLALGTLFVSSGVMAIIEFFSPSEGMKPNLRGKSVITRAFSTNTVLKIVREFIADNRLRMENDPPATCEIFVHLADNRFEIIFGHVDIAIGDRVYTFGNYDSSKNRLFGAVSDGVLVVAPRDAYVKFATEKEEKILFAYEVHFSSEEQKKLHAYFDKFIAESREFVPAYEGDDPKEFKNQSNIMKYHMNCRCYKPIAKKFRTYFAIGTNCVRMVDEAVAATGRARHHISGVLMPGDYLLTLERQFKKEDGYITGRNIYRQGA